MYVPSGSWRKHMISTAAPSSNTIAADHDWHISESFDKQQATIII